MISMTYRKGSGKLVSQSSVAFRLLSPIFSSPEITFIDPPDPVLPDQGDGDIYEGDVSILQNLKEEYSLVPNYQTMGSLVNGDDNHAKIK